MEPFLALSGKLSSAPASGHGHGRPLSLGALTVQFSCNSLGCEALGRDIMAL